MDFVEVTIACGGRTVEASALGQREEQRDTEMQHRETQRAMKGQKREDLVGNRRLGDVVNKGQLRGTMVNREELAV